ncbi:glycosyltransferase 2 family protein [Bathymodiolus platifrons methanotrophic gill symbiont]|uniref:lysylphosphatidylglycerol synthase transmembrane domain-containing protein n=1 Tax=Bathymodiolus platifrons methanotrophic gill symbiont TaxID=113268 RepID=UPI0011CC21BC|nr:lysylphosphatidylglycerol synthase transmembrane domain-containing protein [Bathymodiolus platifrons methanotrophic gill symbiont]TXK96347.1 lysylphosphatidylglycerol synthetase [Methylococcaceae bacterium HT1]TXL17428.1 lysylphosphatidylglycerol synthetase [Methylococcaceae bacterium HT3]TXL23370.1 lysylphosphatidylglycerol synthetase [Methylococcaceae bacterium HT2]GFO75462.1 glycosyltransferase 2 family protein [Bathymodiolus platifrons methanotrophic gill symbiont]
MKVTQIARVALGISCAVFFIWLIASQIEPSELMNALQNTNPSWIFSALLAFCCGYACRIARWRKMLLQDNSMLSFKNCAGPLLASFAMNNVLPFRSGDVMRAFAFNRQLGTSSGIVLASLFVERLLDLLMVLLMLGSALAIFHLDFERFAGIGGVLLISLSLLIILVLLFPRLFTPLVRLLNSIITRLAPGFGKKLATEINKGMASLIHLSKKGTMLILVFWSCAAWLAEGTVFWCVAMALLPAIQTPDAGWLALPVGTLATLIPSTPGYIGTFDYFTIKAMTTLGNTTAISTAYALLVHALLWIPPTLTGGVYLLALNTRKSHTKNI